MHAYTSFLINTPKMYYNFPSIIFRCTKRYLWTLKILLGVPVFRWLQFHFHDCVYYLTENLMFFMTALIVNKKYFCRTGKINRYLYMFLVIRCEMFCLSNAFIFLLILREQSVVVCVN